MPTTAPERGCFDRRWQGEPLTASSLRLRPLRAADAPAVAELAADPLVALPTARIPHPMTPAAAQAFVADAATATAERREVVLVVERLADRRLVGCVGATLTGAIPGIGYWVGRPHWGGGIATEAVKRLVRLLFEEFGAPCVGAQVVPGNAPSRRVLAKAGFVAVGEVEGETGRCRGQVMECFELAREDWMARWAARPHLLVAAAALVDPEGRVLVAERPAGRAMAGLWEFPGGKVKAGETPEAALCRELAEELGIDATASCLAPIAFASHAYEDFQLLMPLYACRTWKGTPAPREHAGLRWLRPAELARLPMPPADVPLIALLRDLL